jgi:phosphoesterase RecJ-like protein
VDPTASSCGELVLELIFALGLTPDRKMAMALYTAIATDTGLCRYSNTNERTFRSLAYLYPLTEEGDFYQINKRLFETKSRAQLALEAFAIQEMAFAAKGKLVYLSLSLARQKELHASYEELNVLVSVLRQVEGVEAAMVIKERDPGEWKVSVRSEKGFDASAFCAHFGGGGHLAAAGCTLKGEEKDVLQLLIARAEGSFA